MKKDLAIRLICVAWICFLAACGLPSDLKQEAKQKTEKIASARTTVSGKRADYMKLTVSDDFTFFQRYAKRENWSSIFDEAQEMLNQAQKEVTGGRVAALLQQNSKEQAGTLRIELAKIDRMIRTAVQRSKVPNDRMAALVQIKKDAPNLVASAETAMGVINESIGKLENDLIPKARTDYPNRVEDIVKRFSPLKNLQLEAETAMVDVRGQLKRHAADEDADYAVLGAGTDLVKARLDALKKSDSAYRKQIGELYQSYTKILEDMRIDYLVSVGRVSWDDNSDFWQEHNHIYPPAKVDRETYDFFAKLDPNTVPARFSASWGGGSYTTHVPAAFWKALNIQPTLNWPHRSDNVAEFWIEDLSLNAFHKYLLVENGKRTATDWLPVDEEDYFDNQANLGMEILSKPYGYFEDERVKEASPPGMAFVGDKRYGEWRSDAGSGRSFWYYYGIYSFLNRGSGHYYYRNGWGQWRNQYRNRRPYYGGTTATGAAYGTYGTNVRTDSRYQNTDFAKRGGLRAQAPSVRGAGPARRGGGPGGRGK
ncbi:MAG: hypothetical protein JEZ11_25250 [Desulfobacterales bacterium]|nr:hypothetical protein [Desulfobacterales bacterium]